MRYTTQVGSLWWWQFLKKRRTVNAFVCLLFPQKEIAVTVFETLMLAIAFAILIVKISNKNDKK